MTTSKTEQTVKLETPVVSSLLRLLPAITCAFKTRAAGSGNFVRTKLHPIIEGIKQDCKAFLLFTLSTKLAWFRGKFSKTGWRRPRTTGTKTTVMAPQLQVLDDQIKRGTMMMSFSFRIATATLVTHRQPHTVESRTDTHTQPEVIEFRYTVVRLRESPRFSQGSAICACSGWIQKHSGIAAPSERARPDPGETKYLFLIP
jgi:hypothetical protein